MHNTVYLNSLIPAVGCWVYNLFFMHIHTWKRNRQQKDSLMQNIGFKLIFFTVTVNFSLSLFFGFVSTWMQMYLCGWFLSFMFDISHMNKLCLNMEWEMEVIRKWNEISLVMQKIAVSLSIAFQLAESRTLTLINFIFKKSGYFGKHNGAISKKWR